MRVHHVLVRRIRRITVFAAALLVLGAVTATTADAGTKVTGWGSTRQVALAQFNGRLYMAWIDPHANNELTITSTADGINFAAGTHPLGSGNSNSAPALAVFNGRLWLAWTGTDSNSTLNLSSSANGTTFTQAAQPLGRNNSPDGPALTVFNGRLYYAWRGTDASHVLNLASSANGSTFSAPIQPGLNSSVNAPALAAWNGKLYMAWTGTDQNQLINLASSADGVNFSQFAFQGVGSNFEPSMSPDPTAGVLDIDLQNPINSNLDVLAYSGQQNIVPFFLTGPIVEAPAVTAFGSNMIHAWLGTDPGHTINVCVMNAAPPYC
jgi:hypothetical protein